MTTEKDPSGKAPHEAGAKLDAGKNRLWLVLGGFHRALKAVGEIGTAGALKYSDNGWKAVENGQERYMDAALRHLFDALDAEFDATSGQRHLAHAAWNILAVLELRLREAGSQPSREKILSRWDLTGLPKPKDPWVPDLRLFKIGTGEGLPQNMADMAALRPIEYAFQAIRNHCPYFDTSQPKGTGVKPFCGHPGVPLGSCCDSYTCLILEPEDKPPAFDSTEYARGVGDANQSNFSTIQRNCPYHPKPTQKGLIPGCGHPKSADYQSCNHDECPLLEPSEDPLDE